MTPFGPLPLPMRLSLLHSMAWYLLRREVKHTEKNRILLKKPSFGQDSFSSGLFFDF